MTKRIYFAGIGGVGIGPLAMIAHDAGYDVTGSDQATSLMTEQLDSAGVAYTLDQSGSYLRAEHAKQPFAWFIHTAALPDNHPELVAARELGIRTAKRDELLAHIITHTKLKLVAVAGTHGKTTTSGMLVWALEQLGVPVSYSVGSNLPFGPSGVYRPGSEYFIYECDEFDRNFLHFTPWLSLVTSVDYDHPDTYPTEADYQAAFRQFGEQSSHVITWQQLGTVFNPRNVHLLAQPTAGLTIPGQHNRANASLVLAALQHIINGQPQQSVAASPAHIAALNSFPGTARRFEKLGDNLYSDYGHHPVEITATLQMAREVNPHVVLVYQPHQNVRQHEIISQYTDAVFADAERIYWLPTYLTREDPRLPVLTPAELTKGITHPHLQQADMNAALWQQIQAARRSGALVLAMGAGSIDEWLRQQLTQGH